MRITRRALLVLLVAASLIRLPAAWAQDLYKAQPGPWHVEIVDEEWRDAARDRAVPVRIYMPRASIERAAADDSKHPVVVFSHGLGGSRMNYRYFGEHLASHGYIVILPSHAGSDTAALLAWGQRRRNDNERGKGWLKSSIDDPENLANRPRDISFVIDQLALNAALKDSADRSRIGVGGHSFGAYTALCVAGMVVDLPEGKDRSFRDPRVKAALPMSPQGSGTMGVDDGAWTTVSVPVLCLTGTRDYGEGARPAAWRREPFEHINGVDDYLVTITDAGHMTFGNARGEGRTLPAAPAEQPEEGIRGKLRERLRERSREESENVTPDEHDRHLDLVRAVGTAFFDAYVKDDSKARQWLSEFSKSKRADCVIEFRSTGR